MISRKLEPKFPTLFFVWPSISRKLSNEVLFAGFGCENAIGSGDLPNFSSDELIILRSFFENFNFGNYEFLFSPPSDRIVSNLMRYVIKVYTYSLERIIMSMSAKKIYFRGM